MHIGSQIKSCLVKRIFLVWLPFYIDIFDDELGKHMPFYLVLIDESRYKRFLERTKVSILTRYHVYCNKIYGTDITFLNRLLFRSTKAIHLFERITFKLFLSTSDIADTVINCM